METSTSIFLVLAFAAAAIGFLAILVPMCFRKVVPTNEVHIVQTGKKTISYGKDAKDDKGNPNGNVYYKWPTWLPVIGVEVKSLQVSIFNIELEDYEAFDKGKLQFLVDVVAFFRISNYDMAAMKVSSTNDLVEQLTSIVKGSVRSILAKSEIEQIMEERSVFGDLFTKEVEEQLKAWGVESVKNIELMDVKDAPESKIIHNIMDKKKSHIEMESRTEVAKNKRAAQIAEIEAQREIDLQKQQATQQVGLRTVEAKKEVELAEENKKQFIMEQNKVTAEKEMDVLRTQQMRAAEIDREVAEVNAKRDKEVALINANKAKEVAKLDADKNKEVAITKAEADAQTQTKLAEATLQVSKKNAEGSLEVSKAEAAGIEAKGLAVAKTKEAELMAPVNAQTTLAEKIGQNKDYQAYLLKIEEIKANMEVGKAQAEAIGNSDMKIIANTGTVDEGLKSFGELFTAKGGTQVGLLLEGLKQTEVGKDLLNKAGIN